MKMRNKTLALTAALALALGASSAAQAVVLNYTFDPGSVLDFGEGNIYAATGGFSFDTVTFAISNVTYEAVQIGTGPTGPFIFTLGTSGPPTQVTFSGDCCNDENTFFFAQSLVSGDTIAITGGAYFQDPVSASGSVTAAAVPEPSTWAMFTLGFGGLGLAIRSRRKQQAVATTA